MKIVFGRLCLCVKSETLKYWKFECWGKMRLGECEFCEKWDFENVNLWKVRLWKGKFCEKWDFEILKMWILGKNEALEIWILSKIRLSKCEFSD